MFTPEDIDDITLTPEEIAEAERIAMERLLAGVASQVMDGSQESIEKVYSDYYLNEIDKHSSNEDILTREAFSATVQTKRT